ncbi:MAG: NCS2 family permease [Erysipelotrichales bacterium]
MNYLTKKLDAFFNISESGSNIKREVLGGISGYLAMAYIIFVNPSVLADAGMNPDAVFAATVIGAAIATLIMGLYAKFPLGLAPCMSMNAFFAYSVVKGTGFSWEEALACVFVSSVLFIILSISGMRFKILQAIPDVLKNAGSVGLGLFIAFIGFKNSGIIVADESSMIKFGSLTNPNTIMAMVGILVLAILLVRKSKSAVILSMLSSLVIGLIIVGLNSNGIINLSEEVASTLPALKGDLIVLPKVPLESMFNDTFLVALKSVPKVLSISGISVVLTFTFLDFFGTAATLSAATTQVKNFDIDTKGNKRLYFVDAISSLIGSLLGTSNITTYIESVSGIVAGARTGLMAVVMAVLFLLSLFLYPLLSLFTSAVTAPALIAIGIFMFQNVSTINWNSSFETSIPAFLTIVLMPLTGSIALGLTFGFIFYTLLMLIAKRRKEIHNYMYVIAFISIIYIISEVF